MVMFHIGIYCFIIIRFFVSNEQLQRPSFKVDKRANHKNKLIFGYIFRWPLVELYLLSKILLSQVALVINCFMKRHDRWTALFVLSCKCEQHCMTENGPRYSLILRQR